MCWDKISKEVTKWLELMPDHFFYVGLPSSSADDLIRIRRVCQAKQARLRLYQDPGRISSLFSRDSDTAISFATFEAYKFSLRTKLTLQGFTEDQFTIISEKLEDLRPTLFLTKLSDVKALYIALDACNLGHFTKLRNTAKRDLAKYDMLDKTLLLVNAEPARSKKPTQRIGDEIFGESQVLATFQYQYKGNKLREVMLLAHKDYVYI